MSRPEHSAPPEIFYNEAEAEKYTNNTRMMSIQVFMSRDEQHHKKCWIKYISKTVSTLYSFLPPQADMSERALELLCLPDEPCYILDLGCGSGLSGECIEEQVTFVGICDVSTIMMPVYPLNLCPGVILFLL